MKIGEFESDTIGLLKICVGNMPGYDLHDQLRDAYNLAIYAKCNRVIFEFRHIGKNDSIDIWTGMPLQHYDNLLTEIMEAN